MRTTMIIPPDLVDEARQAAGLKSMFGSTEIDIDLGYSRGRQRRDPA